MPHAAITRLGGNFAVAVIIADDADGSNSGVTIVGRASLTAGGGLIVNSIVYLLLTL